MFTGRLDLYNSKHYEAIITQTLDDILYTVPKKCTTITSMSPYSRVIIENSALKSISLQLIVQSLHTV